MSNEKKEVAKVATVPKMEEKRAEKAVSITELLEKQLSEIKRKKQLADRRAVFLAKDKELTECLTLLDDEQKAGNFTTDNYTLMFAKKSDYRNEEAFKISNPFLMIKFLNVLQLEMKQAVTAIEAELLTDL